MKTMYKARGSSTIIPVQVVKETSAYVFLPQHNVGAFRRAERREAKVSSYERYFDTEAEALDYLIAKARSEVDRLKRATHSANSELGKLLSHKARSAPAESSERGSP